jgi:hypothetical protein
MSMASPSSTCAKPARPINVRAGTNNPPSSTAKSTGSTKKSSMCAATTSGRRIPSKSPICRWTKPKSRVSHHRLDSDPSHCRQAALSAARRSQSPTVRVGVVSANGGKTTVDQAAQFIQGRRRLHSALRLGRSQDAWVETLTRDHKHKDLYFADASRRPVQAVLEQNDDKFFDEKYDISVADGQIVFTSWEDGHTISISTATTRAIRSAASQAGAQLTKGDFDVTRSWRRPARKVVYYSSNEGNPTEQQFWQVSFDGERKQSPPARRHDRQLCAHGGGFCRPLLDAA